MKKFILVIALMTSFITIAQKKNGTVYIEHPAIDVVNSFTQAFVKGDTVKLASLLTDDFKNSYCLFKTILSISFKILSIALRE